MRDPHQSLFNSVMLILGILIAVACAPVGRIALAGSDEPAAMQATPVSAPEAAAAALTGPQVYNAVCIACHGGRGVGGAPALGDVEAWAPRLAQGADTLNDHAVHGFSSSAGLMPAKGGRLDLSDQEIIWAVEYMVEQIAQ